MTQLLKLFPLEHFPLIVQSISDELTNLHRLHRRERSEEGVMPEPNCGSLAGGGGVGGGGQGGGGGGGKRSRIRRSIFPKASSHLLPNRRPVSLINSW